LEKQREYFLQRGKLNISTTSVNPQAKNHKPKLHYLEITELRVNHYSNKLKSLYYLRHYYDTHLLEIGQDIRTIQELLDQNSVKTIMIYTHVLNRGLGVKCPLD